MKLLIPLVGVVILALIFIWAVAMLGNHQAKAELKLQGSKKNLRALNARSDRLEAALREIRDVAATSGDPLTRDPAFEYIIDQANQALNPTDTKDTK